MKQETALLPVPREGRGLLILFQDTPPTEKT